MTRDTETATLAGGCFWCVEAALEEIEGVESVTSGYTAGSTEDPTYEEVCSGETGHAEAVRVEYDPETVSYADLLGAFFTIHDPTTLDRQGPDVGSQYRSGIYYHDEGQKEIAESYAVELEESGAFDDPIVTEIEPVGTFYEAEEYHQNYFEKNPNDTYCTFNAEPKIRKIREKFATKATQ